MLFDYLPIEGTIGEVLLFGRNYVEYIRQYFANLIFKCSCDLSMMHV